MRHQVTSVMIYAAGLGTRMRPLTLDRPKALVEVAGRALIDHALDQTLPIAPRTIVVNSHAHASKLERHLATRPDVLISREDSLLDTGGGLRKARPLLGEGPVFALNSDAVWTKPTGLSCLQNAWRPEKMDALLLLVPPERAHGHAGSGSFALGRSGQLQLEADLIYTGAQIVNTELMSNAPDGAFSIWWLWQRAFGTGRLHGVVYDGHWADVGTPSGIEAAKTMLERARV